MEAVEESFETQQIVWAKITGYPWWPARITQLPSPRNQCYRVDFFSDNTHAFLAEGKLLKYRVYRENLDFTKSMGKGLRKAIAEADRVLEELALSTVSLAAITEDKQLLPLPVPHQLQPLVPPEQPQPKAEEKQPQEPVGQQQSVQESQSSEEEGEASAQVGHPVTYSRQQRQTFVRNLLKKYRLANLPKCDDVPPTKSHPKSSAYSLRRRPAPKKSHDPKTKRITKLLHQRRTLSSLLTRKIHHLLKRKQKLANCKEISVSLSRDLLNGGPEEVSRLFKWVSISSSETIASFYENWGSFQSEKERLSNMTAQD